MIITVSNLVSSRTGEGRVQLEADGRVLSQMSIEEARQVARHLLECAAVAEVEQALLGFLTNELKLDVGQAAQVLHQFRLVCDWSATCPTARASCTPTPSARRPAP